MLHGRGQLSCFVDAFQSAMAFFLQLPMKRVVAYVSPLTFSPTGEIMVLVSEVCAVHLIYMYSGTLRRRVTVLFFGHGFWRYFPRVVLGVMVVRKIFIGEHIELVSCPF